MARHEITITGIEAWVCDCTGIIKGYRKWSSGGDRVNNHPQSPVYRTYQHQEFWVVSSNGEEHQVSVRDRNDIAVRDGHSATLLWGANVRIPQGPQLAIRNNATGQISWIADEKVVFNCMQIPRSGLFGWGANTEKFLVAQREILRIFDKTAVHGVREVPRSTSETFLLSRNAQQFGPYTLQDLKRYLQSGDILRSDIVKSASMKEWVSVADLLASSAAHQTQRPDRF